MDELDKKIKHIWRKSKKLGQGMKAKKCPGDNLLVSYMDGVIRDNDKEKVERHLLECNHCLELVITHYKLKEAEAHEAVPEVPVFLMNRAMNLVPEKETKEGFSDIVFKFARETIEIITNPGNLGISFAAVPAPVRGEKGSFSADHIALHKTFTDIESEVEVLRVDEGRVNIRVMNKDIKSGRLVEGLRISLFDPHRETASHIAKKGVVLFEGLNFGKLIIKISRQGKEIGQISLDIKE